MHDNSSSSPKSSSDTSPEKLAFRGTPLTEWAESLTSARGGQDLLDRLLSPADSAELVPQLPVDDLYAHCRAIGLADADPVLALASDEQVRGLLDSDGWDRDELKMERLDPWLNALMRCGPDVLGRKLLSLDDSILTELLKSSTEVLVIEDPENFDAPDVEHVRTPDGALCV